MNAGHSIRRLYSPIRAHRRIDFMTHPATGHLPLDHVAIAVHSLDEMCRVFESLTGDPGSPPEELPAQGVRVAFVGAIELLEPLAPDTPVGRFLERRGQALHHVAYRVRDLAAELERLAHEGVELIDHAPRPGARGHRVAFVHPASTGGVLVELVEHGD